MNWNKTSRTLSSGKWWWCRKGPNIHNCRRLWGVPQYDVIARERHPAMFEDLFERAPPKWAIGPRKGRADHHPRNHGIAIVGRQGAHPRVRVLVPKVSTRMHCTSSTWREEVAPQALDARIKYVGRMRAHSCSSDYAQHTSNRNRCKHINNRVQQHDLKHVSLKRLPRSAHSTVADIDMWRLVCHPRLQCIHWSSPALRTYSTTMICNPDTTGLSARIVCVKNARAISNSTAEP